MKKNNRTCRELREDMDLLHQRTLEGSADLQAATVANNTAGKILQTVKLEMEYAKLRKEKPEIEFMQ